MNVRVRLLLLCQLLLCILLLCIHTSHANNEEKPVEAAAATAASDDVTAASEDVEKEATPVPDTEDVRDIDSIKTSETVKKPSDQLPPQTPVAEEKKPEAAIVELESPEDLKRILLEKQDAAAAAAAANANPNTMNTSQSANSTSTSNSTLQASTTNVTANASQADPQKAQPPSNNVTVSGFNYAAIDAGAVIMASNKDMQGAGNLLISDPDKYSLSPCSAPQWFVVSLSEEILVTTVELANFERYSSSVRRFQLLGAHKYPTEDWTLIGEFERPHHRGTASFAVPQPVWARYIRFVVLNVHGNEHYCTLSKIRVYGQTTLETLREDLAQSQQELDAVKTTISDHQTTAVPGLDQPTIAHVDIVNQGQQEQVEACNGNGGNDSPVQVPNQEAQTSSPTTDNTPTTDELSNSTAAAKESAEALALSIVAAKSAPVSSVDNIFKTLMEKVKTVAIDVSVVKACVENNNDKVKAALDFLDRGVKDLKEEVQILLSRQNPTSANAELAQRLIVVEKELESLARRQHLAEILMMVIGIILVLFRRW